jgi:hypothetical protein
MAQLDQINDDFRALNSDIGGVATAFEDDIGDPEIEFCLATQDGNGDETTGIIRWNRNAMGWTAPPYSIAYINGTIKPATDWDRDDYLNFWILHLDGNLGFAQFPGGSASTDGVVCTYTSVGSVATPYPGSSPFDLGRTGTHEIGHWLNLYHIWYSGGCSGDDGVFDTPLQDDPNYGAPSFPTTSCSNGPDGDMFYSYMDYVDDSLMLMFSAGQAVRMQACLATSRLSLQASSGCEPTLPILIAKPLEASFTDGDCVLTWSTSGEVKSDHYIIERASEDMTFESIGRVEPVSPSSREALDYRFTDSSPRVGVNYYRFRHFDADGASSISNVVSLSVPSEPQRTLYLTPNPASSQLNCLVEGLNAPHDLIITDLEGRIVLSTEVTKASTNLDISTLAPGVYNVKLQGHGHATLVSSLVVQ